MHTNYNEKSVCGKDNLTYDLPSRLMKTYDQIVAMWQYRNTVLIKLLACQVSFILKADLSGVGGEAIYNY